jgi:hypothetical protein
MEDLQFYCDDHGAGSLNPQASIRIEFASVYSIPPAEAGLNADIRLRMSSGEALTYTGSMVERENIDRFACYVAAINQRPRSYSRIEELLGASSERLKSN